MQLREKNLDRRLFLEEAAAIKELCDSFHVPFVINDDVEIALASGADGVHVGQKDMDVKEARRLSLIHIFKDELLTPFIDLNTEYYDLGLEYRDKTCLLYTSRCV